MSLEAAKQRIRQANGHAGYYSRPDVGDPEKAAAARRDAEVGRAEVAIHKALATAPPITTEQRERLAALLAGGAK